jgi:hypothetical protein
MSDFWMGFACGTVLMSIISALITGLAAGAERAKRRQAEEMK